MSHQWPSKVAAIIFDLDGVLLDSEPLNFEATHRILAPYGIEYTLSDHDRFSGPRWTPENRPVVDGSNPASGRAPRARVFYSGRS